MADTFEQWDLWKLSGVGGLCCEMWVKNVRKNVLEQLAVNQWHFNICMCRDSSGWMWWVNWKHSHVPSHKRVHTCATTSSWWFIFITPPPHPKKKFILFNWILHVTGAINGGELFLFVSFFHQVFECAVYIHFIWPFRMVNVIFSEIFLSHD